MKVYVYTKQVLTQGQLNALEMLYSAFSGVLVLPCKQYVGRNNED